MMNVKDLNRVLAKVPNGTPVYFTPGNDELDSDGDMCVGGAEYTTMFDADGEIHLKLLRLKPGC